MDNSAESNPTIEPVVVITKPSLKSKRFEDQVKVIRIFEPDQEKMVSALRYILSLPIRN